MKWYKKVLIAVVSIILLVVLLNVGLNMWIATKLPHIINEANDSPYQITYKKLEISLLDRNLKATEIIVVPKVSLDVKQNKPGIYAKINAVEVSNFSIWSILTGNQIRADKLLISTPDVTIIKGKKDTKVKNPLRDDVVAPFSKLIFVDDVAVTHGSINMIQTNSRIIMKVYNIAANLDKIRVSESTLKQKLPFSFNDYSIKCDSLFYQKNAFYHFRAQKIISTPRDLKISSLEMAPDYSRREFVKRIPKEKDIFAIKAKVIAVSEIGWGFKNDDFFVNIGNILIDGLDANIYRSKIPPDDFSEKKLYSKMLRDIPFEMNLAALNIKNSRIVYEEAKDFIKGPGILTFNALNLSATGISSAVNKKSVRDVKIRVDCRFMNAAPLHVNWSFNVLDKSDSFKFRGRILKFPAERISAFTKPYVNADIKGDLDEVYFNFSGNHDQVTGEFAINYDDLKVSIYRKNDRKKKNKILSAIANLFVKNDTKEKVKNTQIDIDPIREKSFFNLIWRSIAEGLRKILI